MRFFYKGILVLIFVVYLLVLTKLILFKQKLFPNICVRIGNIDTFGWGVNLNPIKGIVEIFESINKSDFRYLLRNLLGNILAFIPLSMLSGLLLERFDLKRAIYICLSLSATYELIQGITGLGVMDIDDLIYNILGGIIGYGCFAILKIVYSKYIDIVPER